MDRLAEIRDFLKAYKTKRIREKLGEISSYSGKSCLEHVVRLLQEAEKSAKKPWEPACLCLFQMFSSLVTDSHEYLFFLTDERLYLDDERVEAPWNADFLYTEERERIRNELQSRFVRLSEYEVSYAKHWLQYGYGSLMEVYWGERVKEIKELAEFRQLRKKDPFYFLYGDYMGDIRLVSQYQREEG